MIEEGQTLVIDNGSFIIKAGFAGKDMPCSVFPSEIGYSNHCPVVRSMPGCKGVWIADELRSVPEYQVIVKNPVGHGVIKD